MFNDCGVVIESLRLEHGVRRIAYVDIDAHHGDGVYYGTRAKIGCGGYDRDNLARVWTAVVEGWLV